MKADERLEIGGSGRVNTRESDDDEVSTRSVEKLRVVT